MLPQNARKTFDSTFECTRRFTMSQVTATVRERIEAQGFCGLDDAIYAQVNYPLRLSPTICMVWVAVGTALASPTILWALVPFAALGGYCQLGVVRSEVRTVYG
jgi:hypothetical protein